MTSHGREVTPSPAGDGVAASDAVPPTRLEVGGVAAPGGESQAQQHQTLPALIGYTRVSTDAQADSGAGLDAQQTHLRAGDGTRYTLVDIITDAGVSARTLNRPGLNNLLARLERGEASGLVVAKLDRVARSAIGFATLLELFDKKGWVLIALDLGVDTSTPSGRLVANVMMAVAQWERETIGVRTREALAAKKASGVRLGRRSTVPDSVRSRIVTLRDAGMSWARIADTLNTEGVPTGQGGSAWRDSSVRACIRASV